MKAAKYPAYKLGLSKNIQLLPEHWAELPLKRLFRLEKREPLESDEIVTAFRDGRVTLRKNRREDGFTNALKEIGYQRINRDDLVIHAMDAFAGAIGVSDSDGKSTPVYSACTATKDANPHFYAYYLRGLAIHGFIESLAKGIRERSTDFRWSDASMVAVPVPPRSEQLAIATFLDRETAKIDALIAEQQRLIELLQEKRQAVISHAVTKGLNPNAPMKDSGVEWLGEVPEHWEIMDLAKTTLLLQTGPFGSQLGTTDYKGEGVAVINPSNISEGSIDTSCGPFIAMSKALELERHKLHNGDLVIARRGEMGRCAVVEDGKEEKLCGTGSILVRPLVWMCTDFMAHIIRSDYSRASLSLNSVGSTMENLSAAIVGKLRIPVPPRDEQVQIVDWIRSIASSYQSLAHNSVRAVELLQERRSALICAAVTGQIDVRGLVEAEAGEQ